MNSTNFSYLRSVKKFDPSVIKGANRMTDKTAIEKALTEMISLADRLYVAEKEALFHTRNEEYLKTIVSMIEDAREALAAIEAEKPAEDIERAYQVLEAYGVPRERAKTLANGIDVLETRYRKDLNCFEAEKQQHAESYHAEQCKACSKWISVKDRLPEHGQDCDIFHTEYGRLADCTFMNYPEENNQYFYREVSDNAFSVDSVTHWQPLPEAPK